MATVLTAVSLAATAAAADTAAVMQHVPFPLGRDVSARFTGTVHRNDLVDQDTMHVPQTNVITFEPGSRSGWHSHGAMTIIGLSGTGIYQEWGKPAVLIRQGDVVQIPAGVSHWHGAMKGSRFQQIVIYDKHWQAPADFKPAHSGPVTDEEYDNLVFTEAEDRQSEPHDSYLFNYPQTPFSSANFNGPVYLSQIVHSGNAAGTPAWTYVVFPQGTYNRWHSHKTGQILIATGRHRLYADLRRCRPGHASRRCRLLPARRHSLARRGFGQPFCPYRHQPRRQSRCDLVFLPEAGI